MTDRLHNKIAIVTGAGQGIGEATARRFVAEGAWVACIDRNAEPLSRVCADLFDAEAFTLDVTDTSALHRCLDDVLKSHGRIDILVNNAAISPYHPAWEYPLEDWRRTLAVNLEAYFTAAQHVSHAMREKRSGRIINISSTQALASEPLVSAYAASKGGILALTRTLAVELAPYEILVNAIAPGCIHTPMSIIDGVDETQSEVFQEWYVKKRKIPMGRPGQPAEIASAALFLASDECQYITGHTLVVDGGLTITF